MCLNRCTMVHQWHIIGTPLTHLWHTIGTPRHTMAHHWHMHTLTQALSRKVYQGRFTKEGLSRKVNQGRFIKKGLRRKAYQERFCKIVLEAMVLPPLAGLSSWSSWQVPMANLYCWSPWQKNVAKVVFGRYELCQISY